MAGTATNTPMGVTSRDNEGRKVTDNDNKVAGREGGGKWPEMEGNSLTVGGGGKGDQRRKGPWWLRGRIERILLLPYDDVTEHLETALQ